MSKYDQAFNDAKNRFRQTGVGGRQIDNRGTDSDTHIPEKMDPKRMVFWDKDSQTVMFGNSNVKTTKEGTHSQFGILSAGMGNNEEKETKTD